MIEISTQLVQQLIEEQFPHWKGLEIRPVLQSGHDNRLDLDADTIERARGWALWKALITCSAPDLSVSCNARHTLNRILEEYDKTMEDTK